MSADGSARICVPDAICTCGSFSDHDYRFCPVETTFSQALQACQDQGMSLVRVDSAAENGWLLAEFAARGLLIGRAPLVFIGGNDLSVSGEWRWTDGALFWNGAPVDGLYSNWGSPPVAGGQSNCCGMSTTGIWVDRSCNSGGVVYACESQ